MPPPPAKPPLPRRALGALAAAGLIALAAAGCGRRGALEPPQAAAAAPVAASAAAQSPGTAASARTLPVDVGLGGGVPDPNPDAVRAGDELSVAAVPPAGTEAPVQTARGAKRGYRIPKEPFILDPLL